jgi:hypothetical protein
MLHGEAYIIETYISVRWEWLIFPLALLHPSLAFLVLTMFKVSKDTATDAGKISAMPTWIFGLPEETREKFAALSTWNSSHGGTRGLKSDCLRTWGGECLVNFLKSPLLPVRKNQPPSYTLLST